ncbi:MAG: hypothetical protein JW963_13455 [Anaerolineales bacterium]|nr:hypothetical protein [Anaerolineales bacterium]
MTRNRILLALTFLLLATLACSIFVGGPEYPEGAIPVSAEAVQSLKSQIEAAVLAGAQTGTITLLITQEQITSYIAFKMAAQQNPAFHDPQVYLWDGQMQIYGKVERGYLNANVLVRLNVGVDEAGQPKIEIASADFGPFPAPDGLKQSMTAVMAEAFTGSLGPIATGFRLESIDIANGLMTVTGRIK